MAQVQHRRRQVSSSEQMRFRSVWVCCPERFPIFHRYNKTATPFDQTYTRNGPDAHLHRMPCQMRA